MPPLYLLEPPNPFPAWAPFAGVRPVAELRAGVWRVRERWEATLEAETAAILGDHVAGFQELDEPPVRPLEPVAGPAIVGAAWFAPSGVAPALPAGTRRLTHDGQTVAWLVAEGETWTTPWDDGPAVDIDGLALRGTFDLLTALEYLLLPDCTDFLAGARDEIPVGSIILGDPADVVVLGAQVEPGVVFDVRGGPIVLEEGVEVRHGTRLEGPLYIGTRTRVLGGELRGSVFGPRCVARGEIASSVFLGYANKGHEGFVGHTVVGHWVNLGAGTTTSNLKHTYGPVRLDVGGQRIETERTFLGSLIGDHAKTAIGTLLSTGTVVGAGASIVGAPVPKYVPPFVWGAGGGERLSEEGFLQIAERVLPRRDVPFSDERRDSLRHIYRRLVG